MATILVVDDNVTNRRFLATLLGYAGHRLAEAADGAEALQRARAEHPDLIISDIVMPTVDGFEFVRQLRNDPAIAHTVVIFYTAMFHQDDALSLARACGVVYLLKKPSRPETILRTVNEALNLPPPPILPSRPDEFHTQHLNLLTDTLAQKVSELETLNRELTEAYDATLEGWVRALDLRDKETEGHSWRVTDATLLLACQAGLEEHELPHVRRGALLHDIGKIGVPDHILHKPGPLSDEEWQVMRRHPVYAHQMLSPIAYLRRALDIPYCHHERWDGTGYPQGLKQEEIPLPARIFAVVDVWDALSHNRPYRHAWPQKKVRVHLREQAGKHFDPHVVDLFLSLGEAAGERQED
jgi:putative two-component system response regulator